MKRYFWRVSCLWILVAMPLAASTTRIWALNINSDGTNSIDIIDPVTNKIVQTIEGIPKPHDVAFSPDKSRAYVTSEDEQSENALYVVDTKTGQILQKASLDGRRGNVPAITKDGKRLLVCVGAPRNEKGFVPPESTAGALDVVDTTSLKVLKTIPLRGHDCYTTPDGKYWIAGTGSFLSVIDVKTEERVWQVPYEEDLGPISIETNPDGSTRRLFVTWHVTYPEFSVVDFATHKEVARIKLPDKPSGFLVGPFGSLLTRRNVAPVHANVISPDGKILAIACRSANAVFLYSLPEIKLLGYASTPTLEGQEHPSDGGDPVWLTYTPDSKTIYVANAAANVVSAIDVKAMKEVARIPVGKQPDHVETVVLP